MEAHAVLSDPRRRERYDLGEDEDGSMDSGGPGGMNSADLANIFAQFGGPGGGGGGGFPFGHTHGGGGGYGGRGFPPGF